MARLICFLFFFACSNLCFAEIYRWVDTEGTVHYSDQPPPGTVKEEKTIKTAPRGSTQQSATPSTKSVEEQDLDFRQRRAKVEEERVKQEKDAEAEKARKENCERAKGRLKNLQTGGPAVKYSTSGEQIYLNEQEIKQEIVEAQKATEGWCNPPQPQN